MATATIETKFFKFIQNNSGGSFVRDDEKGLGPVVWIEALDRNHAIQRAMTVGIYFNGVALGWDCECCGDRWSTPWEDEGETDVVLDSEYDFYWYPTVYSHRLDGTIERHKKPEGVEEVLL